MTNEEMKRQLQSRVDEYNATLAPDVHYSETARAGIALLREAAGLVAADTSITGQRQTVAHEILGALEGQAR